MRGRDCHGFHSRADVKEDAGRLDHLAATKQREHECVVQLLFEEFAETLKRASD